MLKRSLVLLLPYKELCIMSGVSQCSITRPITVPANVINKQLVQLYWCLSFESQLMPTLEAEISIVKNRSFSSKTKIAPKPQIKYDWKQLAGSWCCTQHSTNTTVTTTETLDTRPAAAVGSLGDGEFGENHRTATTLKRLPGHPFQYQSLYSDCKYSKIRT